MALFLNEKFFQCDCGCCLFEETEIKSYYTDDKKVSEATSTKALKCIECGKYHDISDDYDIIEQA